MRNLILPILVLIIATVSMMIYTGAEALAADGKVFSVLGAFENTVVGTSLVVGGFCSIIISTLLIILDRQVSVPEYARSWIVGIKSMSGAIAILFFAWTINKIVGDMQTGKYLSSLVSGNIPMQFLPVILLFLVQRWHFQQVRAGEHSVLCYQLPQQWQRMPHQNYCFLVYLQ